MMSTGILNSIKAELVKFAGARKLNIFKPHIEKFTRDRKMFSDTGEFSTVKLIILIPILHLWGKA